MINVAALQTQALACHTFTKYFIDNLPNFAQNERQAAWISDWTTTTTGRYLMNHPFIIPTRFELYSDDGYGNATSSNLLMNYNTGRDWSYSFRYTDCRSLVSILTEFLMSVLDFNPMFNSGIYVYSAAGEEFCYRIAKDFIKSQDEKVLKQWEKAGVNICC